MPDTLSGNGLELRTMISADGQLKIWLEDSPAFLPNPDEVVVRVEAAPINPSDIILLLGPADLATMQPGGTRALPTLGATVPPAAMQAVAGRLDLALPVGNEGCGTVVAAGSRAEHLLGRLVAFRSFVGTYAQYRKADVNDCMVLADGLTAEQGAAAFINPLTVLAMVETMRREGHSALVHTAAASNVGRMLNRLCMKDGIALVNIVRNAEQVKILSEMGAQYVLDSSAPHFVDDLADALDATGATLAFDAIAGGKMAETILTSMERVAVRKMNEYSRYGSSTHKQIYIYGVLDSKPTSIGRTVGTGWGVGGWLMTWRLERFGPEAVARLRDRVVAELTTTFASHFSERISLADVIDPETVRRYVKRATGEKFLLLPQA